MKIILTEGTGSGKTKMAAFDKALFTARIANYNLVRLSSIIPPNSELVETLPEIHEDKFGDRLYIVYASEIQSEPNKEAWAGIGWVIATDGSKKGLFTEHEGESEQEVVTLITQTLENMTSYRTEEYSPVQYKITGIKCEKDPVCAIVAAVYESESWT
jgi:arginine decarboxylase